MNPTDFPQANHTFNRPASMTEAECEPLRVHAGLDYDGIPFSVSRWNPTPEERATIAAGAPVWLWVFGRGHPPVMVSAEDPWPEAAGAFAPAPLPPGPDPILDLGDEGDAPAPELPGGPGTPPHLKGCRPTGCAPGCAWRGEDSAAVPAATTTNPERA